MIILIVLGGILLLFFLLPFIDGMHGNYKHAKLYGVKFEPLEDDTNDTSEEDERRDAVHEEQIQILDTALIKYNRLLSALELEYKVETDSKKRAAILAKQITTLEKLNRLIEKREKLE